MHYLVLGIGLIIGIYAFLRFFASSSPDDIKKFFCYFLFGAYCAILLFFTLTGRIWISIGILVVSFPVIFKLYRKKMNKLRIEYQPDKQEKDDPPKE